MKRRMNQQRSLQPVLPRAHPAVHPRAHLAVLQPVHPRVRLAALQPDRLPLHLSKSHRTTHLRTPRKRPLKKASKPRRRTLLTTRLKSKQKKPQKQRRRLMKIQQKTNPRPNLLIKKHRQTNQRATKPLQRWRMRATHRRHPQQQIRQPLICWRKKRPNSNVFTWKTPDCDNRLLALPKSSRRWRSLRCRHLWRTTSSYPPMLFLISCDLVGNLTENIWCEPPWARLP